MEIIKQGETVKYDKTVVALGNFDGLHRAHMVIMARCKRYAREKGYKCGVLLFNEHTLSVITNRAVKIITPEKQKLEILDTVGMDFVYMRDFDKEYMSLSPEEFVARLVKYLNVAAVCVGYDYTFGHKASGNADTLKELGKKYGFDVVVIDEIDFEGLAVKSTTIRQMVSDGMIEKANGLLGRNFEITGRVIRGFQNGTKIGIPTANIEYESDRLIPQSGVYGGYTYVDGKKYKSVINVGNNPTFNADKITIESHILDFNENIYDKAISAVFVKRLRGEIKFNGIDELVKQIRYDIERVRKELV